MKVLIVISVVVLICVTGVTSIEWTKDSLDNYRLKRMTKRMAVDVDTTKKPVIKYDHMDSMKWFEKNRKQVVPKSSSSELTRQTLVDEIVVFKANRDKFYWESNSINIKDNMAQFIEFEGPKVRPNQFVVVQHWVESKKDNGEYETIECGYNKQPWHTRLRPFMFYTKDNYKRNGTAYHDNIKHDNVIIYANKPLLDWISLQHKEPAIMGIVVNMEKIGNMNRAIVHCVSHMGIYGTMVLESKNTISSHWGIETTQEYVPEPLELINIYGQREITEVKTLEQARNYLEESEAITPVDWMKYQFNPVREEYVKKVEDDLVG